MNTHYIWNGKLRGIPGFLSITIGFAYRKIKDIITSSIVKNNLGKVGKNVQILSGFVYRFPKNISIGNNVEIGRNVLLVSENKDSRLIINDNVAINIGVHIDFSGGLTIGRNTLISKNTVIETHDHGLDPHSKPQYKDLEIGENVWVGMNSMILTNVRRIGSNSVIAAGSLVTREVPAGCIVGGVPAKIIKTK